MKKTVFFDIDGTLLLSQASSNKIISSILVNEFEIPFSKQAELKLGGRTDRSILTELFSNFDIPIEEENFQKFTSAYLPLLKDTLQETPPNIMPGAPQLLEQFHKDPDIELGIITGNMKAGAEIKLSSCNFDQYFSFGGYGDNHCDRDDVAALAYKSAEEFLGEDYCPDHLVVIGDTIADITCAKSIGAKSVGVLTGSGIKKDLEEAGADCVLTNLTGSYQKICSLVKGTQCSP